MTVTANPANMRGAAAGLRKNVLPELEKSAESVRLAMCIDSPGFGVLLSPVGALYIQSLDYVAKNLDAGKTTVENIAKGLEQSAANYEHANRTNTRIFQGKDPDEAISFSEALFGSEQSALPLDDTLAVLTISAQLGIVGVAIACSALAPPFTVAAIALSVTVANLPGIHAASNTLLEQSSHVKEYLVNTFDAQARTATTGWSGPSVPSYLDVVTRTKAELVQVGDTLKALGEMLQSMVIGLISFWLAMLKVLTPFLIWLLEMTAAAIGPQAPAVQGVIQAVAGALGGTTVSVTLGAAAALGAAWILLKTFVEGSGKFQTFDGGKEGTPDMAEIKIEW